jgi:hypothetical protein
MRDVACVGSVCLLLLGRGRVCGQRADHPAHASRTVWRGDARGDAQSFGHQFQGCSWRGERYPTWPRSLWVPGPTAVDPARQVLDPAWIEAVTARPCPRCGDKVKLADDYLPNRRPDPAADPAAGPGGVRPDAAVSC